MKLMVSALAAVLAAVSTAQAAPITGSQLSGVTTGKATVYMIDLSQIGLEYLSSITISESNLADRNGTTAIFSGLDLDAIWISNVQCSDVACLSGATTVAALDYANVQFSAGSIINGGTGDLFGTSGGAILGNVATLGSLDAQLSPTVSGFFSTGVGGILTLDLISALNLLSGSYYLYIAEVGANDNEFSFDLVTFDEGEVLVNPVPAALPLMLTGLATVGFFGRRRKGKQRAA